MRPQKSISILAGLDTRDAHDRARCHTRAMGRTPMKRGQSAGFKSFSEGQRSVHNGLTRLDGVHRLIDAPLTADDWRCVHLAYQAFMMTVRKVASDAYERREKAAS